MSWEIISKLRVDLGSNINSFKQMLANNVCDLDGLNLSFKEYERRINASLEIQYSASYIVSILYDMSNTIKDKIRKGGSLAEQTQSKRVHDEINSLLEEYKNHVYTFSSRAKTLAETLKLKQMSNPEIVRFGD